MKKKIIGICIGMLMIATALPAVGTLNKNNETDKASFFPPGVEWEYTYGGDEFDWLYCIEPTSDGGYIATGLSEENNMYYAWLLKVNASGQEEWSTINYEFNGTSIENDILVECVRVTPDGGYLVGGFGTFYSIVHSVWTVAGYFWKTNESGITEWFKPLGNEEEMWYVVPGVFETYNDSKWTCGGYYVGTTSPTDFFLDVALFETDLDGNLEWYNHYDLGHDYEWVRSLSQTSNGFLMSGTIYDNPMGGLFDLCLIKTESDGTLNWSKIFDSGGFDFSAVMGCQPVDDGYILAGITDGYGTSGVTDLWLIGTDFNGDEIWNKTYGGEYNERCYGMDGTMDDGLVFCIIENAYKLSGTKEDTWILNTDYDGNPEWEVHIIENGTQWSQSIVQTEDEGFIVAGRTGAIGNILSDGLIIKFAPFPHFDIELKGSLGVTASITNTGKGDAIGVPWEISVTGGIFGMVNVTKTGTIDILAGETKSISTGLFFGLGKIDITTKIGVKETTSVGTQFILFSIVK